MLLNAILTLAARHKAQTSDPQLRVPALEYSLRCYRYVSASMMINLNGKNQEDCFAAAIILRVVEEIEGLARLGTWPPRFPRADNFLQKLIRKSALITAAFWSEFAAWWIKTLLTGSGCSCIVAWEQPHTGLVFGKRSIALSCTRNQSRSPLSTPWWISRSSWTTSLGRMTTIGPTEP